MFLFNLNNETSEFMTKNKNKNKNITSSLQTCHQVNMYLHGQME